MSGRNKRLNVKNTHPLGDKLLQITHKYVRNTFYTSFTHKANSTQHYTRSKKNTIYIYTGTTVGPPPRRYFPTIHAYTNRVRTYNSYINI